MIPAFRRTSNEAYPSLLPAYDDQFDAYSIVPPRKPSIAEATAAQQTRRLLTNSRLSPTPPLESVDVPPKVLAEVPPHEELQEMGVPENEQDSHVMEQQHVELHQEERTQITAKQRWLWAYNKIIMQLDVSTIAFCVVVISKTKKFVCRQ